jgi:hypothetical protein
MARILTTVDTGGAAFLPALPPLEHASVADAITTAAAQVGGTIGAEAMVAFTQTGDTAR